MAMHLSPRLLSWISAVGLVAVFAGLGAFEIVDRLHSSDNIKDVRHAQDIRTAYDVAKFEITRTGAAASLYILVQTPERRASFDSRLAAAREALYHLAAIGTQEDAELSNSIINDYLPPLEVLQRYFAALDAGEAFTEPLPQPSLIDDINAVLTNAEAEQDQRANAAFDSYEAWQDTRLKLAGAIFGTGLVLVLALLFAGRRFGRRDALAQAELRHLRRVALVDTLTSLQNRRAFEEQTAQLGDWPRAGERGSGVALAMLDVDEFKTVNDTWGHERGDEMLRAVAMALEECLPAGARAFRIGGDELAVVFWDTDHETATAVMDALRRRVEAELEPVTVSIGVSGAAGPGVDPALLRQQADAALYEAKLRGRNLTVPYRFSPEAAPVFPAAKLQAVRHLLAEGAIQAVFQPIWRLSPRAILGYEALARPDERYGLSGPQQAFDIAEQFGRAADLDRLCRAQAIAEADALPEGALLFVNISPYSLTHASFSAAGLRDEFAVAGLEPGRVVLEITERSAVPPDVIGQAARQLRSAGFGIAIDDVGCGQNGIEMLRRVPFDYLKIDRSIITTAAEGGVGRPALMAILAFAGEAHAQVLAEGVESEESLQLVEALARGPIHPGGELIQLVQGFLLGRPASGFKAPGEDLGRAA